MRTFLLMFGSFLIPPGCGAHHSHQVAKAFFNEGRPDTGSEAELKEAVVASSRRHASSPTGKNKPRATGSSWRPVKWYRRGGLRWIMAQDKTLLVSTSTGWLYISRPIFLMLRACLRGSHLPTGMWMSNWGMAVKLYGSMPPNLRNSFLCNSYCNFSLFDLNLQTIFDANHTLPNRCGNSWTVTLATRLN